MVAMVQFLGLWLLVGVTLGPALAVGWALSHLGIPLEWGTFGSAAVFLFWRTTVRWNA